MHQKCRRVNKYVSMRRRTALVTIAFYMGIGAVVFGVLFQVFLRVLPEQWALRINRQNEGWLFALVIALWIQFARPYLKKCRWEWPVTLAVAALFAAVTAVLLLIPWPHRFFTLNESTLAAVLLIPYVQLQRPLRRRHMAYLALAVFMFLAFFHRNAIVIDQAETFGFLLMALIGFDIIDRGILDPEASTSDAARYAWYMLLIS